MLCVAMGRAIGVGEVIARYRRQITKGAFDENLCSLEVQQSREEEKPADV